jgi:predicted unusual protein kinase regulating ubiquinone biosynthesis (AarF/ABC1/UbiB family)
MRLDHSRSMMYADPQPGNYLFMADGRLGFIDFGCCPHHSDDYLDCLIQAERAYLESTGSLRACIARTCDLTEKQAADEARMTLLEKYVDWAWEPVVYEGPFDFSDREYFRRGVELYGQAIRRRYTRSRPPNTWLAKAMFGLRAMLARLEARVDMGAIYRAERAKGARRPTE